MESLPQELLQLVADKQKLTKVDLGSLRLVNKALAAAAAPALFHTLTVWISIKSLRRLTNIADHAQLSCYVQEIVFSPLRFQVVYSDQHESQVMKWMKYRQTSLGALSLSIMDYMTTYKSYLEAQRRLTKDGKDAEILTWAFAKFSRLETFQFCFLNPYVGLKELTEAFGFFKGEDLLTFDSEYTLPIVVAALSESQTRIKEFKFGEYVYSPETDPAHRGLEYAAHRGPADSRPPSYLEQNSASASIKSFVGDIEEDVSWKSAFSQLRVLEIPDLPMVEDNALGMSRVATSVANLIRSAPLLETVDIGGIGFNAGYISPPMIADAFKWVHSHHLRHLCVRAHDSSDEFMVDLMRTHASTLEEVRFAYIYLTSGDWISVTRKLRGMKWPFLKVFILDECRKDIFEDPDLRDYLTHVTNANPLEDD